MKKILSVCLAVVMLFQAAGLHLDGVMKVKADADAPMLIDSFDDYGRVDTENKKEGTGAGVEYASGAGAPAAAALARLYAEPKDLSSYMGKDDAYIHIWLYIENADLFMTAPTDSFLILSSAGNGDLPGSARYDISGLNVVDGWNEVFLPVNAYQTVNGEHPDWSRINFFRLYIHNVAAGGVPYNQTMMLDELSIGTADQFERFPQHQETMIEDFDSAVRFPSRDTEDKKQGSASAVVSSDSMTLVERVYGRPKNLSLYANDANGYIHFWLYVDNVEYINNQTDGRLEISSGGFWGSQVAIYNLKNMKLKSGWNELYLPISGFEILDPNIGVCDWSRVNYFRFYAWQGGVNVAPRQTIKMDGLEAGIYDAKDLPVADTLLRIESYDRADNLLGAVAIDTENKTEGTGSASVANGEIGGGMFTGIESRYVYARDLSFYQGREDAYLHLSLYLENADFFNNQTDARLELSSGTGWGAEVIYYNLAQEHFVDGWNELLIPVNKLQLLGNGEFNWSRLNYTRVYMFHNIANTGQVFKLDDLSIGLASDFDIPEEGTKMVLESYDNPTKFPIDTENKKEGKGSAKVEVTIDGEANYPTIFEAYYSQTKDLSFYQGRDDAYIRVLVYLSNAAWFRNDVDARLELSSGGNYAANTIYYDLTKERLHDGWNEIFVPVSELQSMNNGEFDWTKINYIRLFLHHIRFGGQIGIQTVNVDQMEIGLKSDFVISDRKDTLYKIEGYDNPAMFTVDTENYKEGTGAAMVTVSGPNVLTIIENIYSQKMNLSAYRNNAEAYVGFWMYVEDASLLSRNQELYLELGSAGGWSAGIARYNLADTKLTDGWNEVLIPVSSFENHSDPSVTECDWSAINYVRLYTFSAGTAGKEITQTMGMDGLYIGLKGDFEIPLEESWRVIENFDSPNKFTVDTDNKKEGKGSAVVQVSGSGAVLAMIESGYAKPMNLIPYIQEKESYLHFWVYVEDASVIDRDMDAYFEIGSGGAWNSQISRYDVGGLDFKDGWNELMIPVSEMIAHSDPAVGECDWSHIDYVRFYLFNTALNGGEVSQTLRMDELAVGRKSDFSGAKPIGKKKASNPMLIEGYDNGSKFNVDYSNYKQGIGAAMIEAAGTGDVLTVIESTYTRPKDLSAYAKDGNAWIQFWLYLEDASAFNRRIDAYFELGSGGAWDSQISRFGLAAFEDLTDGWNQILIPMSAMKDHTDPAVGGCDWSRVNYIRVYLFSSALDGGEVKQTMGIDGLLIGYDTDFRLPEKKDVLMVEPYDDPHRFSVNTENFKEGTGAAMVVTESAGNALTAIEAAYTYTKDLSEFAGASDGCVAFWLYLRDVSYFNRELDGFLEFSSGGFWGAEVARYDVTKLDLQSGWNRVVLPLSAFDRSPDPNIEECDWTRVNYIRFYLFNTIPGAAEPQTMMIDGMEVGHMSDFLTDGDKTIDVLKTNAIMKSDGYGELTEQGNKVGNTGFRWWMIAAGAGVVVVTVAVVSIVVARGRQKKKKTSQV